MLWSNLPGQAGGVYDEDESLRYTSKWEFVLVVIRVELLLVGIKLALGS